MGIKFKQIDNLQQTFDGISGDFSAQIDSNTSGVSGIYNDNVVISGWKYFANNVDISGAQGLLVQNDSVYTPNDLIAGGVKIGFPISSPRNSTPGPLGALQVTGGQIYFEDQLNIRNNSSINVENGSVIAKNGTFSNQLTISGNAVLTGLENVSISGSPVLTGISSEEIDWNVYATSSALPSATEKHGMFAHVHDEGAAYMAHNGSWVEIYPNDQKDYINFIPTGNISYQEGRLFYDIDNFTLSLYNDEADISLQIGQEEYLRVRNNTINTITNGSVVRIDGSQGTHPTVSLASADSEQHAQAVGLATHDIESNTFGYITTYGLVNNLNTTGFSAGDEIVLSSVSGEFTSGIIESPNYKVSIGHVITSHQNQGKVLVQVGQPKLGGGDVKSLSSVNVSGITYYDSAANNAGILGSSNNFVYDNASGFIGIGVAQPQGILDINSTVSAPIMPRMTSAQMNAIASPAEGMLIYNTDSGKFAGYQTNGWAIVSSGTSVVYTGSAGNLSSDEISRLQHFLSYWVVDSQGSLIPTGNNTQDIGSAELKIRDIYENTA